MRIGIMGAMPEETAAVGASLGGVVTETWGGRDYTVGTLCGHDAVCVHSRIGKVAAAITATELIVRHRVDRLVFTGLAGALSPSLQVGDVVVAEGLVQYDMDASPLFPPLEVPLTGVTRFATTPEITTALAGAAESLLRELAMEIRVPETGGSSTGSRPARVVRGDIATGDRFVSCGDARAAVSGLVPRAVCVEMEGAAVAQVCHDYGVPFGVMRVVSDHADGSAQSDFLAALTGAAAALSAGVVGRVLGAW